MIDSEFYIIYIQEEKEGLHNNSHIATTAKYPELRWALTGAEK